MKTKHDFTTEELAEIKKTNHWYYNQILNEGYDLLTDAGCVQDRNDDYKLIGITTELLEGIVTKLTSPKMAYCRQKEHGINIYHLDSASPTGVTCVGWVPNEIEYLINTLTGTSQLSPTEDMRTAH